MSFDINTNITSLQAQQYLRVNSDFQSKTINRVTSGLRILSSGDDAAGLAIANGFRSDQAVLSQGIRNANDGLSTLQTIDGGMNNISQLLDRARTLATQSASGTFNGDRSLLNSEFSSVLGEIDRQSQAIGLDQGGAFAKSLSVFIGGGRSNNGISQIANGSVAVDLSKSSVDSKSLGLKGVQAAGVNTIDIGTSSSSTSVFAILGNAANLASEALGGNTDFYVRGPGFADGNRVKVTVNLSGVTDANTLVAALNTAITNSGNGATQQATAFKNANITASLVTDANGTHLGFNSSTAAFQVEAGDLTSNALLGNVTSSSNPQGLSLTNTVTAGTAASAAAYVAANAGTITVRFQGASLKAPVDVALAVTAGETAQTALTALQTAVAGNASLQAAGITLSTATTGSALVFGNTRGESFDVSASGDIGNQLGLGSFRNNSATGVGAAGTFDYSTTAGVGGTFAAGAESLEISVGGGAAQTLAITLVGATVAEAATLINNAIATNATLAAAGLSATVAGGQLTISSSNASNFRLASLGATNKLGFGTVAAPGVASVADVVTATTTPNTFDTGGAQQSALVTFTPIRTGADSQTITLTSDNSNGVQQSLAIVLKNNATPNARSLDEAINTINNQILQSNNTTMQKIVAVKEHSAITGADGIKFLSTSAFQVTAGTNAGNSGLAGGATQGTLVASTASAGGSTADISNAATAASAVNALANSVSLLGAAQAVVGKGQNQFNYAVNLAQSQLTNLAAAESRIRDADLAAEAANLTKAQILLQAGTAAVAQANSSSQAVLALLR
jgi:flagellin